ncbi:MAG TPA: hypothetical protein VGJ94_00715 [Syntrophorhabdaceae bacterium]|jgi:hypothetical protein
MTERRNRKVVFLPGKNSAESVVTIPRGAEAHDECPPLPLYEMEEPFRALIENCEEGVVKRTAFTVTGYFPK